MKNQISEDVKEDRLNRLMTLQQDISLKKNRERLGNLETVLVTDRNEKDLCLGRSKREAPETDGEIVFTCSSSLPEIGSFVQVKLTRAEPYDIYGEMK